MTMIITTVTTATFFDSAYDPDAGRRDFKENEHVVRYCTPADIEFSCSGYLNDFHDLYFDSITGTLTNRNCAGRLRFLSSLLSLEQLTEIICTNKDLGGFVSDLESGKAGK